MTCKTVSLVGMLAFAPFALVAAVTTIEPGQRLEVTDATVGDFADGIAFADATGVVEFNTTAAPALDIAGAGTVKKTSNADWTMAKQIPDFTGDYVLSGGGVVTVGSNTKYFFGAENASGGRLYVKSGTTLYVPNIDDASWGKWKILGARRVVLAGDGVDGRGAVDTCYRYSTESFADAIELEADATLRLNSGYYLTFNTKFTLNGYQLTIVGSGTAYLVDYSSMVYSNGTIRVLGTSSARPTLTFRGGYDHVEPDSVTPFLLEDYASLTFNGTYPTRPKAIDRRVVVRGQNAFIKAEDQYAVPAGCDWAATNVYTVLGAVDFDDTKGAAKLTAVSTKTYHQLTLAGAISGNGSLAVTSANTGRVQLRGENTFMGNLTVDNSGGGEFLAMKPASIPDYAKVTCSYGALGVAMDTDGTWWDMDSVADLANTATLQNDAFIGIDTTYATNTVKIAIPESITAASAPVGSAGPGVVEIVEPWKVPFNLVVGGGTTRVCNPGVYALEDTQVVTPAINADESVLEFSGGAKIVQGTGTVVVGKALNRKGTAIPRLRIKDATYVNADPEATYGNDLTGALVAGGDTQGIVEILPGAVVTNRILVGGRSYGVAGTVHQKGGAVTIPNKATEDRYLCAVGDNLGTANMGYYELADGSLDVLGPFIVGCLNIGNLMQKGGAMHVTGWMTVGYGNGYGGVWTVKGGTATVDGGLALNGNAVSGNNAFAGIGVDGETAVLQATNAWVNANASTTALTYFNLLNGGTLWMQGLRRSSGNGVLTVNFDGGVYKSVQNQDVFNYGNASQMKPNHVYVYSKGAVIDTSASSAFTAVPVEGGDGNGVVAVPWTDTTTKFCYAPIVRIDGDGMGATAEAVYDAESCTVTGIRVTTPGVGYTQATAKVLKYRGEVSATITCEIGANPASGPFVKRGAGTFSLGATNTWGGATVVKGGSLKANCDWAIPTNTAVKLEGGVLDLNHKVAKISSVEYGAGGGQILNAENAEIPGTASLTIDIADLVAGKSVALTGDVDLANLAITITGDVSLLEEGAKYVLATTTGGTFIGKPTYTLEDEPANWGLANRGTKLVYRYVHGMLMLVR